MWQGGMLDRSGDVQALDMSRLCEERYKKCQINVY